MTWRFAALNFEPSSDGHAIWKLKQELVVDGWVVRSSGTGTGGVYGAASDVHAPAGPYAGTLDLATSWFCIRGPVSMSPRREYTFLRVNTTHGVWRIYYSSNNTGFTGGSPSATVPPTATDAPGAASIVGAMVNGNGGTNNILGTALVARNYRCDYIIGDASEGFSFLMQFRKIGMNAVYAMIGLDVLQNANGLDADPATTFAGGFLGTDSDRGISVETNTIFTNGPAQSNLTNYGWYAKGTGSEAWVNFPFTGFGFVNGSANTWVSMGDNSPPSVDRAGRLPSFPMIFSRGGTAHVTARGYKGRSRIFKYEMNRSYGRPYPGRTRWIHGAWSIPWDGSTTMVT